MDVCWRGQQQGQRRITLLCLPLYCKIVHVWPTHPLSTEILLSTTWHCRLCVKKTNLLFKKEGLKRKLIHHKGTLKEKTHPALMVHIEYLCRSDHNGLHHVCNIRPESVHQHDARPVAFVWIKNLSRGYRVSFLLWFFYCLFCCFDLPLSCFWTSNASKKHGVGHINVLIR